MKVEQEFFIGVLDVDSVETIKNPAAIADEQKQTVNAAGLTILRSFRKAHQPNPEPPFTTGETTGLPSLSSRGVRPPE